MRRCSGMVSGVLHCHAHNASVIGNALGLVISLCLIAVWCIVEERFAAGGVLCLAVCLMIKPHDAALVWLYFLLAGGTYRSGM